MPATTISIILGGVIFIAALIVLILNLLCLFVIWKSGLLKHNSIYCLAFSSMTGQACNMTLISFYLGLTSIFQDYIYGGGQFGFMNQAASFIYIGLWYQEMLLQIIISTNRMLTIVFPKKTAFFTRNVVITLSIGVFFVAYMMGTLTHFILPCCRIYLWYTAYTTVYLDHDFNSVDWFVDLPLNFTSSTIAIICYGMIFYYISKTNKKMAGQLQTDVLKKRKNKEVGYALQFAAMSSFILFVWVSFRIFPLIISSDKVEWFSLTTVALILHCSTNAMIFLTLNKEFRQHFFKQMGSFKLVAFLSSIRITVTTAQPQQIQQTRTVTSTVVQSFSTRTTPTLQLQPSRKY